MKRAKFEGSPQDKRDDKINAKKHNMTLAQYQRSDIDKKNDAIGQKKLEAKMGKRK